MKGLQSLGRSLGRQDQKIITGGVVFPDSCSVNCNTGYFACCKEESGKPSCKCLENGTQATCTNGGPGESSCSYPSA